MKIACSRSYNAMYRTLKKVIRRILPKSFIIKNELVFRYPFGVFYKGKSHQCAICEHTLKAFVTLKSDDLLCPFCGSLSRTRRLWDLLQANNALKGNVLHFSPSRSIYRKLKTVDTINYFSSDFENEFLAEHQFDITAINKPEDTFDLIICYHVLEHIEEDIKAMSELYRVLKTTGIVYVQTPFKEGDIYENKAIKTPQERRDHFGQEDHVRIYSADGLKARLKNVGFKVEVLNFQKSESDQYSGFMSPETVFKLTR